MNQATREFIATHITDDVYTLSLKAKRYPDVDMRLALRQIESRQRYAKKLPEIVANDHWLFPARLSLEQCSSEHTARYKASLFAKLCTSFDSYADLTGGMGVDFYYCSQLFKKSIFIEQNAELCDVARHNFQALPAEILHTDSTTWLHDITHLNAIFIDPARRDGAGHKVSALAQCTPDITQIWTLLIKKSEVVMAKISPMLDVTQAMRDLSHITEVHYVGTATECKETLLITHQGENIDTQHIVHEDSLEDFVFTTQQEHQTLPVIASGIGAYLHVPSATMLKAAPYKLLCHHYNVAALSKDTHLYTSDSIPTQWHGKTYIVKNIYTTTKNDIKHLKALGNANISVRNTPFTADELRRKIGIDDGGDTHLFGTRVASGEIIIIETQPYFGARV